MKNAPTIIIVSQVIGGIVVQGLELWRPGSVITVVPLGGIWLVAVLTILLTLWWSRGLDQTAKKNTTSNLPT